MKTKFLLFLFILFVIEIIEARKGKLKIGKKVKRLFVAKKHHNKSTPNSSLSMKSARSSIYRSISARFATISRATPTSIPLPTLTTFTGSLPNNAEVYITLTDRNYNYFLGYPTVLSGVNYFRNQRFMIAGQRPCGCCDNKIIIVTRSPDERII